ncbi:MAG TPA: carboxypeptidase-like regulatory domain-containing protein [Planctomycetota bacterium]|nr:carboxypeptidase-like regulatory domain-containing protein [Planctomycetota bacterium]
MDRLRLVDARVRVLTSSGNPIPDVGVRARLESLDLVAGPVATDISGYATLRLPRGTWRVDAATEDEGLGKVVFSSSTVEVAGAGAVEIRLESSRVLRLIAGGGSAPSPDAVTLSLPDFSFSRAYRCRDGRLEVLSSTADPLLCQAVRAPDERPGFVVRGELPAEGATLDVGPSGSTTFVLKGATGRRLDARFRSLDAFPLDLAVSATRSHAVHLRGFPAVALSLDVDRQGENYSFYARPFDLDGNERVFTGEPPFEVSVGIQHNTSKLYKGRQNSLTFRAFLRDSNGLLLSGDSKRAAYSIDYQEVLDDRVRVEGSFRNWYVRRTLPIPAADIPRVRYRLRIRGPGEDRAVEVVPHLMSEEVRVGKVVLKCHPEVAANARLWAAYVDSMVHAYEAVCSVRNKRFKISLFSEMPPGLAGYGGFSGSEAFAYLPDSRLFGFTRRVSWDGLVSHELGHGFHYGHGAAMTRAGSRARRRFRATLPGMDRVPEGNVYMPFLEAVTRGEIKADQEFPDPAESVADDAEDPGDDDGRGDGVLEPDPSAPDDPLLTWYVRSLFGPDRAGLMGRHRPTWGWWLVLRGYTDAEIEAAILSHATGEPHAWLARLRGLAAHDRRVASATAELAEPSGKLVYADARRKIAKRWTSMKASDEPDLAVTAARAREELGSRERRVDVLLALGAEYLGRGDAAGGRASLLEALEEARRGGDALLKDALDRAAALWAVRASK